MNNNHLIFPSDKTQAGLGFELFGVLRKSSELLSAHYQGLLNKATSDYFMNKIMGLEFLKRYKKRYGLDSSQLRFYRKTLGHLTLGMP